jgi:mRNA-degrading endonuclease RelE of RelBE toxin-antitoxin system
MGFSIEVSKTARKELKAIKLFERRRILEEIETQLETEPTKETRNRKPLPNVKPGFEHNPPLWELRVGEYRVFFDVDEKANTVFVRAVRQKPPRKTTDEMIQ